MDKPQVWGDFLGAKNHITFFNLGEFLFSQLPNIQLPTFSLPNSTEIYIPFLFFFPTKPEYFWEVDHPGPGVDPD